MHNSPTTSGATVSPVVTSTIFTSVCGGGRPRVVDRSSGVFIGRGLRDRRRRLCLCEYDAHRRVERSLYAAHQARGHNRASGNDEAHRRHIRRRQAGMVNATDEHRRNAHDAGRLLGLDELEQQARVEERR